MKMAASIEAGGTTDSTRVVLKTNSNSLTFAFPAASASSSRDSCGFASFDVS